MDPPAGTITSPCPCCGLVAERSPYDIGSGPELFLRWLRMVLGANGQRLSPMLRLPGHPKSFQHDYYGSVYYVGQLDDGRDVVVLPWSFAGAQLSVGHRDTGLWDETYDYLCPVDAVAAAKTWNGRSEPDEWYRHPATGRRRDDIGKHCRP